MVETLDLEMHCEWSACPQVLLLLGIGRQVQKSQPKSGTGCAPAVLIGWNAPVRICTTPSLCMGASGELPAQNIP